ncbi:helix-turn-helix domain-containing protein [Thermoactinospora rubra]|uniref:helix-turn-helix domain-containing protein n=1 Tax=Thermoactinospora rubra TaxID=1088767 RepID=UPI000A0F6271|nr:helix-turn-helix transcriptional regulator [Thermoactinospora rubra]
MNRSNLWADVRLRAAWAREDWPVVFREYRRIAGISQLKLGELIGMPQPHVSAVENGRRRITSAEVISRIVEGLQVPEELGGIARNAQNLAHWLPDPELRERIAHAHATGRTDIRTAEWIGRVLAEHRRAEDVVGGRELWPVVRSQLDAVTRLVPDTSGRAADRLLVLAGEHAHWLSWVAAEHGQYGAALAWLDLAHGWAVEAGEGDLASWVTRVRSFYSLSRGDPIRALRTAEAARHAFTALSPATESVAAHAACMAAAAVGERDRARRLADEAYELALRVPEEADRPSWLYWLDPVRARLHLADAAYAVRDWQAAAEGFREGLAGLGQYPRDQEYYRARLADAEQRA